jgi:hypothetical protein
MTNHILRHNPHTFDRNHPDFLTEWSFWCQACADRLSPGDPVAVYSGGPAFELCAVAKVADAGVYEVIIEPDSGFSADEFGKHKWVRKLEGGRLLEHPVPLSVLKADPRIAKSLFLRMPGGANPFLVTDTEWSALSEAIALESLNSTDTAVA